jgi:hypothetical protein
MNRRKILFVSYVDEKLDDGLSYVFELAKTMNKGIAVLFLYKKNFMKRVEDVFSTIAFAEGSERETAKEVMERIDRNGGSNSGERLALLQEQCKKEGVPLEIHDAALDTMSSVREYLKERSDIDLVLLSPLVSNSGNLSTKVLNRLVHSVARPIVTMARKHRLISGFFPNPVAPEHTK